VKYRGYEIKSNNNIYEAYWWNIKYFEDKDLWGLKKILDKTYERRENG